MALRVTQETKASMIADKGRVLGFTKSDEPGKISIAVPDDRAVMTPQQARELAAWLKDEADRADMSDRGARSDAGWRTAEARRQEEIRRGLAGESVTFAGRTFERRA